MCNTKFAIYTGVHLIQWVLVFFSLFLSILVQIGFSFEISQASSFSILSSFLGVITNKLYAFWKILSNALFHDSAVCNDIGAHSI